MGKQTNQTKPNACLEQWGKWALVQVSDLEPYTLPVTTKKDGQGVAFNALMIGLTVDTIKLDALTEQWERMIADGTAPARDARAWHSSTAAAVETVSGFGRPLWAAREAYTEDSGRIRTRGATVIQLPEVLRPACSAPVGRSIVDFDIVSCHQVIAGHLAGDLDYARRASDRSLRAEAIALLPGVEAWRVKAALLALLNVERAREQETISAIFGGDQHAAMRLIGWWRCGHGRAVATFKDSFCTWVVRHSRETIGDKPPILDAGMGVGLPPLPLFTVDEWRQYLDNGRPASLALEAARRGLYHLWTSREAFATNAVIRELTRRGIPVAVPAYDGLVACPRVGEERQCAIVVKHGYDVAFKQIGITGTVLKSRVSHTWGGA